MEDLVMRLRRRGRHSWADEVCDLEQDLAAARAENFALRAYIEELRGALSQASQELGDAGCALASSDAHIAAAKEPPE